jgi:bifunctional DNase/RNase
MMKTISVRSVRLDRLSGTPVVSLREDDLPRRQFEIFIGGPEAASIKSALDGETTPRPLTHDLYVHTIERLGLEIVRVVLTHVTEGTYFAEVIVRTNDGEVVISSRPSDALAIALRATCPIYASDDLLEMVGEVPEEEPVNTEAEIIDEFRDFIENISPEDFGA